jgi:alpha-D-ribose 1-methylphosphonate 5-triphosphate diphosphatase PhnM
MPIDETSQRRRWMGVLAKAETDELHHGPLAIALTEAVATVSAVPAGAAGLIDRGRIEIGRRADLIRVLDTGDAPVVRSVWRERQQIG